MALTATQRVILTKYAEWLTIWMKDGPVQDPDTVYIADDFDHPEWNSPVTALDLTLEWLTLEWPDTRLIILDVYDGDNGGRHQLICRVHAPHNRKPHIVSIVQQFDTLWTHIYEDGKFIHLPDEEES